MKKIIAFLLAGIMLIGLVACTAKTASTGQVPAAEETSAAKTETTTAEKTPLPMRPCPLRG